MSSFYCKTACKTEPTTLLSHRDITISKISDGSTVYYSARLTGEVGNIDYLVTMQRSARQTLCPSIREDVTSTCTSRSNVAADQPSSHPKQKLIKVKQPRKNCALATEKMLLQPCSDEGRIERPDAASASKAPGTFTLLFSFNLLSEICGKLASDLLMWQLIMQSVTAGCRHKVPFSQR